MMYIFVLIVFVFVSCFSGLLRHLCDIFQRIPKKLLFIEVKSKEKDGEREQRRDIMALSNGFQASKQIWSRWVWSRALSKVAEEGLAGHEALSGRPKVARAKLVSGERWISANQARRV